MRVTILGTRGNIEKSASRHAKHSGILVGGALLFDLGEAAYLRYEPKHIFITHLHADHAAFMTSAMKLDAHVYVPEPSSRCPDATAVSRPVCVGSYRIIPVPIAHSHIVQSVGYIVESRSRRLFYTGDMVAIDKQYHARLRHLDLVITDGSFMRRGGLVRTDRRSGERYGHAGIPDLVKFFRPRAKCIVITHFGSWFYAAIDASVRKIEALSDRRARVLAAYDGLVLTI
jgi:ribonuclease BN (tRNA processing enzyme)